MTGNQQKENSKQGKILLKTFFKEKRIKIFLITIIGLFIGLFYGMMNKPVPLYQSTSILRSQSETININFNDWFNRYNSEIFSNVAIKLGFIDSSLDIYSIRYQKEYMSILFKLSARTKLEFDQGSGIVNIVVKDYDPVRTVNIANSLSESIIYLLKMQNRKSWRLSNLPFNQHAQLIQQRLARQSYALDLSLFY
ncbi:hypothetical protein KAU33_11055 [Candidatus Dependentiae bacterium]|nr:hypothetical protein [Candidatus Dependentiae bacterium]